VARDRDGSLHNAHRERMRERVVREGIDSLEDHEALEVLLYNVFRRGDTNELAHKLIKHFGSLAGVYDAGIGALMKVDGIGFLSAFALSNMTGHYRKYAQSRLGKRTVLDTEERLAKYLHSYFKGRTNEVAYLLTLDTGYRKLLCVELAEGSFDHVDIEPQKIIEIVARRSCKYAVLAHNHTSDIALYSGVDLTTTRKVQTILSMLHVTLLDHLIFDEDDYVSMAQSGVLNQV